MTEQTYFKIHEPFTDVYHIEDPMGVFVTLIVGSKQAMLIDTGMGIGNIRQTAQAITDKPIMVLNTHGHADHIGGNYQFDEVFINAADLTMAKHYYCDTDIRNTIYNDAMKRELIQDDFRLESFMAYSFHNIKYLDLDMIYDLGGFRIHAVHLPSHTPGMTGFYVEPLNLLIGGDAVCSMMCLFFPEASSIDKHIEILKEVSHLPFEYILTSHSREVLDRYNFEAFIECAEAYDEKNTYRYHDPYYTAFEGRMYIYESKKNKTAILVK